MLEQLVPGRSGEARPPTEAELRSTKVVRIDLEEASAKVRSGGPTDEPEDLDLDQVWAGELPLSVAPGTPIPDERTRARVPLPAYLAAMGRPGGATREPR